LLCCSQGEAGVPVKFSWQPARVTKASGSATKYLLLALTPSAVLLFARHVRRAPQTASVWCCAVLCTGGVEEALADWQAAVSVGPVVTGDQEADSSSSCCNCPYHSNALAPQQQPAGVSWHQQLTQQWQPRQSCAAAPAAQTTCLPAPCTWACATQQQQQQQLCNSNNRQQQQGAPATAPAPASASAAACPYAAFKGDVVGAVLAGLVPPPGSNSSDAASWGAVVDMHLEAPAAACF
jgi:hypothetical protein